MKNLFYILLSLFIMCGCTQNHISSIRPSDNRTDSISKVFSSKELYTGNTPTCDTLVSDTIVRVILGDTLENGLNKTNLRLSKLKNENEIEWIKPLQALKGNSHNNINIYFRYAQPIEGYKVTCRFMPPNTDSEAGNIIMYFQSQQRSFQYCSGPYTAYSDFYTENLIQNQENNLKWRNGDIYVIDYISPTNHNLHPDCHNSSVLGYNTPFQFFDIDFDGKKELLVNNYDNGQQGNSYSVYKITDKGLEPIHDCPPFSMLDNNTEIDTRNKRIVTYIQDGCFFASYFFFTKRPQCSVHIDNLPKFNWEFTTRIMSEYTAKPNYFSIDSIVEYISDTIYVYRRNRNKLELAACRKD